MITKEQTQKKEIDNIIRRMKQEVGEARDEGFMNHYGMFIVWQPTDFEKLEAYATRESKDKRINYDNKRTDTKK